MACKYRERTEERTRENRERTYEKTYGRCNLKRRVLNICAYIWMSSRIRVCLPIAEQYSPTTI